jgi:AmiR/NasT family two-component response regulator
MSTDELRAENEALRAEVEQLKFALASRIVIEQAKGILIERLDLEPELIFTLMRSAARRTRMNLHDLAIEILSSRVNPTYIDGEIGRLIK